METKRSSFSGRLGFVLAAAGSAVGLGNLWGFPYKTSANGGAAFVIVYIICVLFLGSIAMTAEIYLGKRAQANTITAYKKTSKNFGWAGLLAIVIPFIIICYYSVLGGWTVRYATNSFQSISQATNANSFGAFISHSFEPIFYTLVFMLLSVVIIMAGVKGGIEKASKVLMPVLFIIVVLIAVYSLTLGEGVSAGLNYYLNPDFSELGFSGIVSAMGQAFYSLSLGMGIMVAYGSYTGKEIKIGKSVVMICIFDTLVALIAGLAIFCSIGHFDPNAFNGNSSLSFGGVGLMYQTLPIVFESLGSFGQVVSFLFFAMVVIAALTSVISLMEVATQFIIQKFKVHRKKAALVVFVLCFIISIPIAWSVGGAFNGKITIFGYDLLTFFDEITNTVLMPLGALFSCFAIGWLVDKSKGLKRFNPNNTWLALKNDGLDLGKIGKFFVVMVKYVTPLLILLIEIMGIIGKVNDYGNSFWWIVGASFLLLAISIAVYFIFFKNTETGTNLDELEIVENKE